MRGIIDQNAYETREKTRHQHVFKEYSMPSLSLIDKSAERHLKKRVRLRDII